MPVTGTQIASDATPPEPSCRREQQSLRELAELPDEDLIETAAESAVFARVTPEQKLTTAVLLGLTLAFEPREPGLMERPPRPRGSPILDGVLVQRILLVGLMLLAGAFGLFEWALHHGTSVEQARTVAANVFAVGQAFYLLNCR